MSNLKPDGRCRLTGDQNSYVKSHLIPLALTRLETRGAKFIEAGIGRGKKTRSNSWYDDALVTRKGEDILADIDAAAIDILREHRLVWSGWGAKSLKDEGLADLDPSGSYRRLYVDYPRTLQLFFLSLLWRAGATNREEFDEVVLAESVLSDLADRIRSMDPGNFLDYPVQLYQLSTKGTMHNRTPRLERKALLGFDEPAGPEIDYVRFYFDGLVAHVHLARGVVFPDGFETSFLAESGVAYALLNDYEESRTSRDLLEMFATVFKELRTPPFDKTVVALSAIQACIAKLSQMQSDVSP